MVVDEREPRARAVGDGAHRGGGVALLAQHVGGGGEQLGARRLAARDAQVSARFGRREIIWRLTSGRSLRYNLLGRPTNYFESRPDARARAGRAGPRHPRRGARRVGALRRLAGRGSCSCRPGTSSTRGRRRCRSPHLARRFRVLTYDPRGNGRSDRPQSGYRIEDHAADALAVLDRHGVERAALISASLGANAALWLALEHPARVERLVLIGEAVGRRSSDGAGRGLLRDYERFIAGFFAAVVQRAALDQADRGRDGLGARDDAGGPRGRRGGVRSHSSIPPRLGEVLCPTLVVHGAEDRIIALEHARAVAQAIPDCRAGRRRGRRASARHPRSRAGQSRARPLPRRRRAPARAHDRQERRAPRPSRAVCLQPDRARPRPPRSRHRRRAARPLPGPRDQLAGAAAVGGGPGGGRRDDPPGLGAARGRGRAHRVLRGRAHAAGVPRLARHGRDPARQLHGLRRRRARDPLRPLDRRRGVGGRPLPAREPRAQDRARTPS